MGILSETGPARSNQATTSALFWVLTAYPTMTDPSAEIPVAAARAKPVREREMMLGGEGVQRIGTNPMLPTTKAPSGEAEIAELPLPPQSRVIPLPGVQRNSPPELSPMTVPTTTSPSSETKRGMLMQPRLPGSS